MTATYRGQADVARWCGVSAPVVSNWIKRLPGKIPAPDVEIVIEGGGNPIRGWLPERRAEWVKFAAERNHAASDAKSAVALRTRRTAALIEDGVANGRIDPAEAVKLLAELIGRLGHEEEA